MKKLIFLFLPMIFLLGGCSRELEVRNRVFIQGIGIEYDGDIYSLCMRAFETDDLYKGSGVTFDEALREAQRISGKDIFTGHAELVVLSYKSDRQIEKMLINKKISAGCLVVYDNEPLKYIEENDAEKITGIVSILMKDDRGSKLSVCDAVNELYK